jgi:hypothetical protein
MAKTNLAGRGGRWSAAHWKRAAFGWILLALLAVLVGGAVATKELKDYAVANGDSRRVVQELSLPHDVTNIVSPINQPNPGLISRAAVEAAPGRILPTH